MQSLGNCDWISEASTQYTAYGTCQQTSGWGWGSQTHKVTLNESQFPKLCIMIHF